MSGDAQTWAYMHMSTHVMAVTPARKNDRKARGAKRGASQVCDHVIFLSFAGGVLISRLEIKPVASIIWLLEV